MQNVVIDKWYYETSNSRSRFYFYSILTSTICTMLSGTCCQDFTTCCMSCLSFKIRCISTTQVSYSEQFGLMFRNLS